MGQGTQYTLASEPRDLLVWKQAMDFPLHPISTQMILNEQFCLFFKKIYQTCLTKTSNIKLVINFHCLHIHLSPFPQFLFIICPSAAQYLQLHLDLPLDIER